MSKETEETIEFEDRDRENLCWDYEKFISIKIRGLKQGKQLDESVDAPYNLSFVMGVDINTVQPEDLMKAINEARKVFDLFELNFEENKKGLEKYKWKNAINKRSILDISLDLTGENK